MPTGLQDSTSSRCFEDEDFPRAGYALEFVHSTFQEFEAGADRKVANGTRDDHFNGCCGSHNAGCEMDRETGDADAAQFDLTRMDSGAAFRARASSAPFRSRLHIGPHATGPSNVASIPSPARSTSVLRWSCTARANTRSCVSSRSRQQRRSPISASCGVGQTKSVNSVRAEDCCPGRTRSIEDDQHVFVRLLEQRHIERAIA